MPIKRHLLALTFCGLDPDDAALCYHGFRGRILNLTISLLTLLTFRQCQGYELRRSAGRPGTPPGTLHLLL
jgi:hypothetical protein